MNTGTSTSAFAQALFADLPDCYAGLLLSDPVMAADPLTVEHLAPTYSRVPVDLSVNYFTVSCSTQMLFYGIPGGTSLYGIGIFDAPVNGNLLFKIAFTNAPVRIGTGGGGRPGGAVNVDGFTLVLPTP